MSIAKPLRNASWALSLLAGCSIVAPLQATDLLVDQTENSSMQCPYLRKKREMAAKPAQQKCLPTKSDEQPAPSTGAKAKCLPKKSSDEQPSAQQPKSFSKKSAHSKKAKSKKMIAKGWFSRHSDASIESRKASLHAIDDVFEKDRSFEIENKTSFSLDDISAVKKVQAWKKSGAHIRILPNGSWTSSHIFKIENDVTGDTVEATLTRHPLEFSSYNRRISEINTATGEIAIQQVKTANGQSYVTTWKYQVGTSWAERDLLRNMLPGDIVIVGDNSQGFFFTSDYSFILINVNVSIDEFVTAKQISVNTAMKNN